MASENKKVEELIKNKITLLKEDGKDNSEEIEKFEKLYNLYTNPYEFLFDKIDINIALAILGDIGLSQEEALTTYQKVIKENLNKKYTLINIEEENEEER